MAFIAPSGRKKEQMNQGACRHDACSEDLFSKISSDILAKLALSPPSSPPGGPGAKAPEKSPIGDAMNQGNMRGNKVPPARGQGGMDDLPPDGRSVQPSGIPKQPGMPQEPQGAPSGQPGAGGEQMSPFLSPTGEDAAGQDKQLLDEKMRLRQAAGHGFAINLKRGKEGTFDLTLIPPQGYKIPEPDQFVQTLLQSVDGEAEEIGDPDPRTGAMRIVYKSRNIGPTKIMKGGK